MPVGDKLKEYKSPNRCRALQIIDEMASHGLFNLMLIPALEISCVYSTSKYKVHRRTCGLKTDTEHIISCRIRFNKITEKPLYRSWNCQWYGRLQADGAAKNINTIRIAARGLNAAGFYRKSKEYHSPRRAAEFVKYTRKDGTIMVRHCGCSGVQVWHFAAGAHR